MSLALFTYCLPILLGYILYVGISGRLDPVSRPRSLAERPSWALGLWVALAVASVLTVGLHMAYTAPLENVTTLFVPSVQALSAALLAGLAGWFVYRGAIVRALESAALNGRDVSLENARIRHFPVPDETYDLGAEHTPDAEILAAEADDHPLVGTFLDIASPEQLDIPDIPVAAGDTGTGTDQEPEPDDPEIDAATDARAEIIPDVVPETVFEVAPEATPEAAPEVTPEAAPDTRSGTDAGIVAAAARMIERNEPIALDVVSRTEHEVALGVAEDLTGTLSLALRSEEAIREETEQHLRVTRRALARLEAESRDHEGDKADALIALEEELESRIRESATAESKATREAALRVEAETRIVALKRDVLAARRDARRGTAARAKALSAATRAIALSRQAVMARARLEKRLRKTEATLADRETTLSSVIRALEKEKGRTQEEIGALARQLVLHEKQLRARRSMEEVARSVEGKLTTRLARKVARARPLVTNG